MGKKRKADESSDDASEKKKKSKKAADKKDKKKKSEKDKKVKKKDKKKKKQESSSSSNSEKSNDGAEQAEGEEVVQKTVEPVPASSSTATVTPVPVELPPPEDGIKRFEFTTDQTGPLGLRFSGGFPPLILQVNPDSFAGKKGVPPNFEVHAINGLPLVPQNRDSVMNGLKARPVVLDVRPQGWKPKEKVKEMERRAKLEEAEMKKIMAVEEQRREQVAREAAEQAEREAAERAEREIRERAERQEMERRAKEVRAQQKALQEEFDRALASEPPELRRAAEELMEAEYGTDVKLEGRSGLPLRLLTRQKDVAWVWAGEVQELIGGGTADAADTWTQ